MAISWCVDDSHHTRKNKYKERGKTATALKSWQEKTLFIRLKASRFLQKASTFQKCQFVDEIKDGKLRREPDLSDKSFSRRDFSV